MRKTLIVAFLLCAGIGMTQATHGLRFERILDEHHDANTNHVAVFEVWHDKESGQEFTCAQSRDSNSTGGLDGRTYPVSCFPTGRNWK
jgi:hypothetical protein